MNIVVVLGVSFMIREIPIISTTINNQLLTMALLTGLLFIALYYKNKLSRGMGIVFLLIYGGFILLNFDSLWIG
jgi:Ca2+/Na+ antiporter